MSRQLQEAQQAANDEGHLQYKEWLKQGQAKGLRGLFKIPKSSEVAWQRPYRHIPQAERMDQRLQDWATSGRSAKTTSHMNDPIFENKPSSRRNS